MKRFLLILLLPMLILCVRGVSRAAVAEADFKPVADEMMGAGGISWAPKVNYARLEVTVNRPDGTVFSKTFIAGSTPYLDLSSLYGESPVDGMYTYELLAVPEFAPKYRNQPERAGMVKKRLHSESQVQTGYFMIRDGMIVTSNAAENVIGKSQNNLSRAMDEVIYDDLIVDGSLCVGNDCYSGYAFGFDTIVLMENNLRIYFDDTSNTSSFPNNDWRIVINDTTDGGGAYYAIQDVSGGLTPFTIEAGAKSNSLYIDDDGQVGIGTSGPVFELHIKEGDTPTVRLHQSTEYGWPEQIWDIGGNETSFFIRDGSHAAKLPFRIEPDTPSSSLCLKSDGKVGIGTWSPLTPMELETTGEHAVFIAERTDGATAQIAARSDKSMIGSRTNHNLNLCVNNSPKLTINTNGYVGVGTESPSHKLEIYNGSGSNAYCDGGAWVNGSSRKYKENIKTITVDDAVDTLVGLNPVMFNYKGNKEEKYLGFIAEDVPEMVATKDRKGMSAMDVVAVLTKVVQEQQKSIQEHQHSLQKQQEIISELKEKIEKLEKK